MAASFRAKYREMISVSSIIPASFHDTGREIVGNLTTLSCSGFPSSDRFIKTKPPSLVYGNGGQCFKREIEYQRNIVFCLGLSAWKAPLHPSFCCRKWAGLPQIAIKPCSGNGTPADALPPNECTAAVLDISLNLFVSWKLNLRRFLTFHTGIPDTMLYIACSAPQHCDPPHIHVRI
jgi:hypothetical protein